MARANLSEGFSGWGGFSDAQDEFAAHPSLLGALKGIAGAGQRVGVFDEHFERAGVDQVADLGELRALGFDEHKGVADARVGDAFALGGDGDEAAAGLERGPRSLQGFAADGVEDDIDVTGDFFKARGAVIDDDAGAEVADEGKVAGGGGGEDAGAAPPG